MARRPKTPPQDLVMLTARVPRELATQIKIVAATRYGAETPPCTVQDIVAEAVRDWLKAHGHGRKR
ncbi:MAG: hypothetical protein IID46_00145 [Planctomycetes bacterium]|nr:hypothetical protein [Planctomycetota bacterium]